MYSEPRCWATGQRGFYRAPRVAISLTLDADLLHRVGDVTSHRLSDEKQVTMGSGFRTNSPTRWEPASMVVAFGQCAWNRKVRGHSEPILAVGDNRLGPGCLVFRRDRPGPGLLAGMDGHPPSMPANRPGSDPRMNQPISESRVASQLVYRYRDLAFFPALRINIPSANRRTSGCPHPYHFC